MSYFKQYDIAIQKTGSEQIKVRDYQEKLRLAQGELPGKKKEALDQLAQTRNYMQKVGELKARENAQHGDIDKQVGDQQKKIIAAAKDLARQAGEARLNINKYRHAAFEQKRLAIANHQDLVRRFWRDTIMGLEVLTLKQGQLDRMIYRACSALSRAVFGRGTAKYRVIYPQLPVVTEGEMPPRWSEVESADKRIDQINKAEREQEAKICEHEGKLHEATASLKKRADGAHDKVDAAVAERGKQLVKGKKQEAALIKHIKKLGEKEGQLASESDRMTDAEMQLAAQKSRYVRGKAQAVARVAAEKKRRDTMRPIYEDRLAKYQNALASAKTPEAKAKVPRPKLERWFLKEKGLIK